MNRLIGYRIKLARKHAELTQEKLAEKTGLSTSFISRLENGKAMTSIESLCSIADSLDVGLENLLYDLLSSSSEISDPVVLEINRAVTPLPDNYKKYVLEVVQALNRNIGKS